MVSCAIEANKFEMYCVDSNGDMYSPALTDEELTEISIDAVSMYDYTYGGTTYTVDRNYFNINSNDLNGVIASQGGHLFNVQGFMKIWQESNSYTNTGHFIPDKISLWSPLNERLGQGSFFDFFPTGL